MAFVIYVSDLEDWLEFAISLTYADDTTTSISADTIEEVKKKLEIDAKNVLKFMASNGLVANASKTTLIFFNAKLKEQVQTITVGNETVSSTKNARLLGITIDDNQKWKTNMEV